MTGLVSDCLRLCKCIYDGLGADDEWTVVNIAKNKPDTFVFSEFNSIPTSYGYNYDNVLNELLRKQVFEEAIPNKWFIEWRLDCLVEKKEKSVEDVSFERDWITITARQKKYVDQEIAIYYPNYSTKSLNGEPMESGQYAVLVNKSKLTKYINSYENVIPRFSLETGEFNFLGENLRFAGDLESKTLDLLINNINSIVPKEEFYNLRKEGDISYLDEIKRFRKTEVDEPIDQMFKKLKKIVSKNIKLKRALLFVLYDGLGLFTDENILKKELSSLNKY